MATGLDILQAVGITDPAANIDWELRPEDTFGTFESWGGRERVRHKHERFYYFFIDGWQTPPRVSLMERGVKHARILARIDAPQHMITACINGQGHQITLDRSYAIDQELAAWLRSNLVDRFDAGRLSPVVHETVEEMTDDDLPPSDDPHRHTTPIRLPPLPDRITEAQAGQLIRKENFYDRLLNPTGRFANHFVNTGDGLTVIDRRTGIMWQRQGYPEVNTLLQAGRYRDRLNRQGFAGHHDWRLPTLAEAMSLLKPEANRFGHRIHSCFSIRQPYIFTVQHRRPGGHWFVDFMNGNAFWASASNPGGYARLCRSF